MSAGSEEFETGLDLEEIASRYEERGFFRRLKDMMAGLKLPHDTREYKLARIELQRLAAPLISIVGVTLFVVILIVVTAVSGKSKEIVEVEIAQVEEPIEEKQEEEEPEEPEEEPPPEDVEITVDSPDPGPVSQLAPVAGPPTEVVSVKPSNVDAVAFVDSPVVMKSLAGSRTPGRISGGIRGGAGYGDKNTEAVVMKVLWWLKARQATDGSWRGGTSAVSDTALAVLTYLAHGEYPGSPSPFERDFGPVLLAGVNYLVNCVRTESNPVKMTGADGHEYAFLIATYALCEAYGMTQNPDVKEKAQMCLERIVKGQSSTGGWDYNINPGSTRDDVSFAGWAIQALKAGKMAGIKVAGLDECIKKAILCLQTRNHVKGGFNYTAGGNPTGLTATGCLAMQLLGYGSKPEVAAALDFMRDWQPSFSQEEMRNGGGATGACPQYYCYYATQCKYQAGMKNGATKKDLMSWQQWNVAMKKVYPSLIQDNLPLVKDSKGKGHKQGFFENKDVHTSRPVMDTCLVALQLMVYYRYLPTNQLTAGLDEGKEAPAAAQAVDKGNDVNVEVDI